ncbi:hypothetical protein [Rummeliibacillus stabekisii]|uniref:hypothetical protein n=1 Tax=Rummeliibacillus stabekisii TaxID=241244 RepID=UPI003717436A
MKNLITLSNAEINTLVKEYQVEQSESTFNEIYDAVYPVAEQIAYGLYQKSQGLCHRHSIQKDEFAQCASIAVFKAVNTFNFAKAGNTNFTTSVRQYVQWTIQDEIFKKYDSKENTEYSNSLSFDKETSSGGTFLQAVEHQFATDPDAIFDSVAEDILSSDTTSLSTVLVDLVKEFSENVSEDDSQIIKVWVATILNITDESADVKKAVNTSLQSAFPDVASATIRKRKSRAEKKFNTFALEKGFSSFCLSQF